MSRITVVKNGSERMGRTASDSSGSLTVLVHVQSYRDRVPRGTFTTLPDREQYDFCGLDQMLLTIEDLMDAACVPEERLVHRCLYQRPYVFQKTERTPAGPAPGGAAALCADQVTFVIQVFYRQHRSMQGRLSFQSDQKQESISFRSSLELMRMLHEYLSREQDASRGRTGS